MRLAWVTDVHLDFLSDDEVRAFCRQFARRGLDALAISGDIAEARSLEHALPLVADELRVPIYFVLGNHDFYNGSIAEVRQQMAALTRTDSGIHWLPARGIGSLGDGHAVVGHDGWADGRHGDRSLGHGRDSLTGRRPLVVVRSSSSDTDSEDRPKQVLSILSIQRGRSAYEPVDAGASRLSDTERQSLDLAKTAQEGHDPRRSATPLQELEVDLFDGGELHECLRA